MPLVTVKDSFVYRDVSLEGGSTYDLRDEPAGFIDHWIINMGLGTVVTAAPKKSEVLPDPRFLDDDAKDDASSKEDDDSAAADSKADEAKAKADETAKAKAEEKSKAEEKAKADEEERTRPRLSSKNDR